MAPTIAQIMQGLETRLATISGLNVSEAAPNQITPPFAFVGVPNIPEYRIVMGRASFRLDFTVTVLVSTRATDVQAQLTLAGYANPTGATSIITAIEGDKTLGGVVDDCVVDSYRNLGIEEVGALGFYGGTFSGRIIADGT